MRVIFKFSAFFPVAGIRSFPINFTVEVATLGVIQLIGDSYLSSSCYAEKVDVKSSFPPAKTGPPCVS